MKNSAFLLVVGAALYAQTASITGRVTDSSAAVIPAVSITVESVETSVKTSVVTNEDGYYTVPQLPRTYSKMIDYGTGTWNGETLGGAVIQNFNNLRADRSVAELDQTHRFILNGAYELQVGKGMHGLAKTLVRGWQVGGILSLFGGEPLGLNSAVNNTFSQGGGQRPNWTGVSPKLDNPTPDHWFDTSQFSSPAPYAFGNAGRTSSGNRAATTRQLVLTLSKRTQITEKLDLQFRAEFFNFTNTPHFDPPNVSFGNQLFGVVSAQGNQPRIVQFALKLNY